MRLFCLAMLAAMLLPSAALANSIREGKTQNIRNVIQSGRGQGM